MVAHVAGLSTHAVRAARKGLLWFLENQLLEEVEYIDLDVARAATLSRYSFRRSPPRARLSGPAVCVVVVQVVRVSTVLKLTVVTSYKKSCVHILRAVRGRRRCRSGA